MDSQVMVRLGDFKFSVSTAAYQKLERETSWRWPVTETVGVKPTPQFVGPGDDTITLSGVIYPHYASAGLGQLDAMREQAGKGVPLRMVDGTGKIWGLWGITRIREGQTVFWSNGAPRCQEFDIGLVWAGYGV